MSPLSVAPASACFVCEWVCDYCDNNSDHAALWFVMWSCGCSQLSLEQYSGENSARQKEGETKVA